MNKFRGEHRRRQRAALQQSRLRAVGGDGLLRRQYGYRDVELRAAFRHERQLLRDYVRAVRRRALNLISGQTHGADRTSAERAAKSVVEGSVIARRPIPRARSTIAAPARHVTMTGQERGRSVKRQTHHLGLVRRRLQADLAERDGTAVCGAMHNNIAGASAKKDYIPHHQPFQYYPQTANPHHWRRLR